MPKSYAGVRVSCITNLIQTYILLMIAGILLFAFGAFHYRAGKQVPDKATQAGAALKRETGTKAEPTTDTKAYEDGLAFEKYIVQRFNQKYFKVKQWTGDKQVAGYFVEGVVGA